MLAVMSWSTGTKTSLSTLAGRWRWLLLAALWSQLLLIPAKMHVTPEKWRWLAFVGMGCVGLCGAANVTDKVDERVHSISAVVGAVLLVAWVAIVNFACLFPVAVCAAAGRENWKWRVEVGLIISVYVALFALLGIL